MQVDDDAAANHIAVRSPVKEVTLNSDSLVDGVVIADLPGGGDTADEIRMPLRKETTSPLFMAARLET